MNDQDRLAEQRGSPQDSNYLTDLIGKIMSSPPPSNQTVSTPEKTASESIDTATQPPSDLFSSLLSNPELISKLPAILSSIKPIMELFGGRNTSTPASAAVSADPSAAQASKVTEPTVPASVLPKATQETTDRRAALLCAMKPYLSHDRQQTIDYVIKLSRLGDILKTL